GLSIIMYAQDHNGDIPPTINYNNSVRWAQCLVDGGYIPATMPNYRYSSTLQKPIGAFACPSAPATKDSSGRWIDPDPESGHEWYANQYGMNNYIARSVQITGTSPMV